MELELPEYPGRGVVAFRDAMGELWWMYFLTGRSDASRDRSLLVEAERVVVVPCGGGDALDPLRHYSCVRTAGEALVVGNGAHVDALADALLSGSNLDDVIDQIDPEPDPPINTPRIAIALGQERVGLLSVRDIDGDTVRLVEHVTLADGCGVVLHTYGGDSDAVTTDARAHRFDARVRAASSRARSGATCIPTSASRWSSAAPG